jgi:hypothetical protein
MSSEFSVTRPWLVRAIISTSLLRLPNLLP